MKLKKRSKPSAILTADWHIRVNTPECRTDDFLCTQEKKVKFIVNLTKKHDCPVLIAGDIGDKHQWPNWLLRWFVSTVKGTNIIAIPGQHDLPGHRIDEVDRSAQGVLSITEVIDLRTETFVTVENDFNLISFPYSKPLAHFKINRETNAYPKVAVAMTHQMIVENKPLWPGQEAPRGNSILKKFSEYLLILSGDNHNPFTAEYKGRVLINPGSMMRTTAAQIDHKPRVYLWWADSNEIKPVYLPIEKEVISRDHIEEQEERDERHEAYITRMRDDYEIGFSYEGNLKEHIEINEVEKEVKERIWEMIE